MDEKGVSLNEGIIFDLIPPVLNFTGRTTELKELSKLVLRGTKKERVAVVNQVTVISGLGGIGKTQLAREYANLHKTEFNGNVLWMTAGSKESLARSFRRLAEEKLKLPIDNGKVVAETVYEHFKGKHVLFIFDNAENEGWLKGYMPKVDKCTNIFILITSRNKEWDDGFEILQLGQLSENEAISLLKDYLKVDQNNEEEQVKELVTTLQCFPLALQQAIAYINEQQKTKTYGIKSYLKEFNEKQLQLLDFNKNYTIGDKIYSTTTATTWKITLDKIKSETAIFILNIIAYLDPDRIRRDLFYQLRSISPQIMICHAEEVLHPNDKQVDTAVSQLIKYSLLNGQENQSILSVHRLVQAVTRIQLQLDNKEEQLLGAALNLLNGGQKRIPLENAVHALTLWKHGWNYKALVERNVKQILQIMRTLRRSGYHVEGIRFGEEAAKETSNVFGKDHEHYFDIQRRIALVLNQQGRFDEAVQKFQNILPQVVVKYGMEYELSLKIKENLGNALRSSGKCDEAVKLLEVVLKSREARLRESHSDFLNTKNNIGFALLENKELKEADETFKKLLKTENNIGFALLEGEQLQKAEEAFKKLLDYYSDKKEHKRRVLLLQCNLAVIHSHRGEFQQAFEGFKGVYDDLCLKWDKDLDFFALACSYLGNSYCNLGQHAEALKLMKEHIENIEKRLGSKHLRTLQVHKEIGNAYAGLGNFPNALAILEEVRNGFAALSGNNNENELETRSDKAQALFLSGEYDKAVSEYQEILEKMEGLSRKIPLFKAKRRLALAIERSGKDFQKALKLLEEAKDSMITILGECYPAIDKILKDIKRIGESPIQEGEENRKRKATVNTDMASPPKRKRFGSDSYL